MWNYKVTSPTADFLKGTAAYDSQGGSWRVLQYNKQMTYRWGVVPWPQGPQGNGRFTSIVAPLALGIPAQAPHREEAWEFIKFMTSRRQLEQLMRTGAGVPALISATRVASVYREDAPKYTSRFLELAQTGHDPWLSGVKDPVTLQNEFARALPPIVTGTASVRATLSELARNVNLLLSSM